MDWLDWLLNRADERVLSRQRHSRDGVMSCLQFWVVLLWLFGLSRTGKGCNICCVLVYGALLHRCCPSTLSTTTQLWVESKLARLVTARACTSLLRSPVRRFRQKPRKSNLYRFELHRPSIKGTKWLFYIIKTKFFGYKQHIELIDYFWRLNKSKINQRRHCEAARSSLMLFGISRHDILFGRHV